MKILIACEFSGTVREAFRALGHKAYPSDYHIQGDVRDFLTDGWDLMIAHPPCTYLSISGLHWNTRIPGRKEKTEEALEFVQLLMDADIPRICVENPVSCISSRIRKPDQIIQPWEYGHDASKQTCLWLKGLPLLKTTGPVIFPRVVHGKRRWANQMDSGQNKLGETKDRWKERSKTYQGIANAMAQQWGNLI
jgi:hypothetical protein